MTFTQKILLILLIYYERNSDKFLMFENFVIRIAVNNNASTINHSR